MHTPSLLDCGHPPTLKPDSIGTGYGRDSTGKTFCYACCAERDRLDMIETGKHSGLYLTDNAVINWPGTLSFPVLEKRRSRYGGGFNSQRTDAWFRGPDGYIWHAVNRGDMQLARCRRTKTK